MKKYILFMPALALVHGGYAQTIRINLEGRPAGVCYVTAASSSARQTKKIILM